MSGDGEVATAEQALENAIQILRAGANDLAYAAPEVWPKRAGLVLSQAWAAVEAWDGASGVDYKLDLRKQAFPDLDA